MQNKEKIRRSLLDKVLSSVTLTASITLYVVDELVKDFIPSSKSEIKFLIVFIGALSLFAGIWSFIWDRKIMRLEIEVARLKKGYLVKGVGEKKEYVTTQEKNTK